MESPAGIRGKLLEEGLIGPFKLSSIDKVEELGASITKGNNMENIHSYNPLVKEVLLDSNIVECIKKYFGSDYYLWRTNIFTKSTEISGEVAWHHDKHFQDGDADIDFDELGAHVSILVALEDVHLGNGPLDYIPGSHRVMGEVERDVRPYHLKESSEHFIEVGDALQVRKKTLQMKKGEFALFHSALLHKTACYNAGNMRSNLIGRLAKNGVIIPAQLSGESNTTVKVK